VKSAEQLGKTKIFLDKRNTDYREQIPQTLTPHRCQGQSLLNRRSVGNVHLLYAFHFGKEENAQICNACCHREKVTLVFSKTSILLRQIIGRGSDELKANTQLSTTGGHDVYC
jgi:hypothetical protein